MSKCVKSTVTFDNERNRKRKDMRDSYKRLLIKKDRNKTKKDKKRSGEDKGLLRTSVLRLHDDLRYSVFSSDELPWSHGRETYFLIG